MKIKERISDDLNNEEGEIYGEFDGHEELDPIRLWLIEVGKRPLLSAEQEVELSKRIEAGDEEAKIILIESNLRLVVMAAKKYYRPGISLLDLIQEGNLGLIKAAERFDHRLNCRFSTYAFWWVRQAVSRFCANQGRTIRQPVHLHDRLIRLIKTIDRLRQELAKEPTAEDIAKKTGMLPEDVAIMLRYLPEPLSMEMPATEDPSSNLENVIADEDADDPEVQAIASDRRRKALDVIGKLPPREQEILKLRLGFVDGKAQTLEQVGRHLHLTRERIRQLEKKALAKLRLRHQDKLRELFT